LGFLDIGLPELLLVLVVILVAFGPNRVVEIGRTLGKTMHLTIQMSKELDDERSLGEKEKKDDKTNKPAKS
jgi:sec-independent protein translocase protein TatA